MKKEIYDALDKMLNKHPVLKADDWSKERIRVAEEIISVEFHSDYREFLEMFGGAVVGPMPIYGVGKAAAMDDEAWSVVEVTNRFRSDDWPLPEHSYVISEDHAGNPFFVKCNGAVYVYDHDVGEESKEAETFSDFLLKLING